LTEKEAERHRQPANIKEDGEDLSSKQGGGKERHFSYYAYAGLTGQRRWSHKSEDFHRDPFTLPMIPQHNYKLDAASLNSRHTGEVCDSLLYLHSVIFFSRHTSMCRTSYFCSLFQHSASSTLWDYFKMLMNFSKHSQFLKIFGQYRWSLLKYQPIITIWALRGRTSTL
jgi:hypothetical protein